MTRYIISDTHLGHGNLIDYVNRPFDDVEEMNKTIVENWNSTVDVNDTVIHLGDFTHHPDTLGAAGWVKRLNGNILLVRGNHDDDVSQNPGGFHVVNSCTIHHGRFQFYLEHQDVDSPGWQIMGHYHDNDMRHRPFINPQRQTVNVSVELIDYTPLKLDTLVRYLDERERFSTIEEARQKVGL